MGQRPARVVLGKNSGLDSIKIGDQIIKQIMESSAVDVDRCRVQPCKLCAFGIGRHQAKIPAVIAGARQARLFGILPGLKNWPLAGLICT